MVHYSITMDFKHFQFRKIRNNTSKRDFSFLPIVNESFQRNEIFRLPMIINTSIEKEKKSSYTHQRNRIQPTSYDFQVGHEKSWFTLDGPRHSTHCRSAFVISRRHFVGTRFRKQQQQQQQQHHHQR